MLVRVVIGKEASILARGGRMTWEKDAWKVQQFKGIEGGDASQWECNHIFGLENENWENTIEKQMLFI